MQITHFYNAFSLPPTTSLSQLAQKQSRKTTHLLDPLFILRIVRDDSAIYSTQLMSVKGVPVTSLGLLGCLRGLHYLLLHLLHVSGMRCGVTFKTGFVIIRFVSSIKLNQTLSLVILNVVAIA